MITLDMMPPLMFGGLILAMLIGFPVAFTLAALGLSFGFLSIYLGFFDMNFLQAIPGRIFGGVLSNELLLAIPSSLHGRYPVNVRPRGGRRHLGCRWPFVLARSRAASATPSSSPASSSGDTGTVARRQSSWRCLDAGDAPYGASAIPYGVLASSGTHPAVPPSWWIVMAAISASRSVTCISAPGTILAPDGLFAATRSFEHLPAPSRPAVPGRADVAGRPLWRKCLIGNPSPF